LSDDAEAVVREYMIAAANGEGETACALFTQEGIAPLQQSLGELEGGEPPSCEEAFAFIAEFSEGDTFEIGGREVAPSELESLPLEVEILDDGTAEVTAAGEDEPVNLVQAGGGWLIDGLPTGGAGG